MAGPARDRLMAATTKLKYRLLDEAEGYYRFQPPGGLVKPKCMQVEVWLDPDRIIAFGPSAHVKRLAKRVAKLSK
jgi:hypothetical protein